MRFPVTVIGLILLWLFVFNSPIGQTAEPSIAPSQRRGGEGLIPPTRALDGREEEPARLVVVSEPPKLEVFLNGTKIGQTPVWLKEVEAGPHTLRVGDSEETDILLESGKRLDLAYFKGSFIEIPEKKEVPREPAPEPKKPAEAPKRVDPRDRKQEEAIRLFEEFISGAHDFF